MSFMYMHLYYLFIYFIDYCNYFKLHLFLIIISTFLHFKRFFSLYYFNFVIICLLFLFIIYYIYYFKKFFYALIHFYDLFKVYFLNHRRYHRNVKIRYLILKHLLWHKLNQPLIAFKLSLSKE
jgi:hypothetical protein